MEKNNNEPVISDEEVKMPEEQFGITQQAEEERTSHLGIILGVLIVVLVVILGGLYLWSTTIQIVAPTSVSETQRPTPEENNEPESTNAEAQVQALDTVSTSDEISAIEADIESSNFDELDAELEAIEAELDAALE